jgi:hypothetical protein
MSYDLYLSSPQLNSETFVRYFEGRPHYEDGGWYANADTGVYFSFDFCEPDADVASDPEAPEVLRAPHVAFNMNFFRPHIFGLEAAPEVAAFVAAFDCTIHDPQDEGMGDGAYSIEGFLRGWNFGNVFGYRVVRQHPGASDAMIDVMIADDALIEGVWRWNLHREASQSSFGEDRFLPRVSWAKRLSDGSPVAFALWSKGVPTAIPECATHALLAREPRWRLTSLFSAKKSELETKLVPIEEVAVLAGCAWSETPVGRLLLAPIQMAPPSAVLSAFEGGFAGIETVATPFATDHVLNASLIAEVSK